MFDLTGQVVLVTGAAQGLGLAIANACAGQGASLVVADRNPDGLNEIGERLRSQETDVLPLLCDVSNADQLIALVEKAWAWKGRIDTLVSNAGIQGPAGPLDAIKDEDWDRVLETNLHGAQRLCAVLAPRMAMQGGGSIVLMSSIAALRGNRSIGLYAISKAALSQLARNLAVEWGPKNIRVNSIAPGLIRTPLANSMLADNAFMQRRLQSTPLRRVGEPYEIAGPVVLLASRAGGFINGHTLVVDGGTLISDGS